MCDQHPLDVEDRELEAQLQRLIPSSPRLQRDTLMFEAGRRAARPQLRVWQGAAALLAGAVFLGTLPANRPTAASPQALAPVSPAILPRPAAPIHVALGPSSPAHLGTAREYLRWRSLLLTEGVEALPNPPACAPLPDPPESWARWSPGAGARPAPRLLILTPQGKGNRL